MENDTVKLLRECNAGIKMGESAISKVLPHAKNGEMKKTLEVCKNTHASLGDETHAKLLSLGAETKDPHPVIRAMSDMKIYAKMMNPKDKTVADVITDGCDMGVKSLNKYLNQYEAAEEFSKDICKKLIKLEDDLAKNIRNFL